MFFNGQNHFRARRAISGLAAITGLLLSGSALAGEAEILWDQFGIPHIYGPDLLSWCAASAMPKWKTMPRRSW